MTTRSGNAGDPVLAASCERFGSPFDLRVGPITLRPARAHEVVLDVVGAGANFADGLMVTGQYQIKPELPFVPGGELVGIVATAGGPDGEHLVGRMVLAMTLIGGF